LIDCEKKVLTIKIEVSYGDFDCQWNTKMKTADIKKGFFNFSFGRFFFSFRSVHPVG
jgi:hypothetical protein